MIEIILAVGIQSGGVQWLRGQKEVVGSPKNAIFVHVQG